MRAFIGKYETIVRLGLAFVVFLLLLLNINTTYVLHSVKEQLTDEADRRLEASLSYARRYLTKNQTEVIGDDQIALIMQKYNIARVDTRDIPDGDIQRLSDFVKDKVFHNEPDLTLKENDLKRLLDGDDLYCSGTSGGDRLGLALVRTSPGRQLMLSFRTDSSATEQIGRAARTTLYLAAAVLILILPIVIGLPRRILKPFKQMREAAQSAGKLIPSQDHDEVTEVIESYEEVIEELKIKEAELERLVRESSSRADRLEKLNHYILKSINSGVVNVDLTGKVIGYNRAAMDILGYDENLVLGRHYLTAFPQETELTLLIQAGLERGEVTGRREIELQTGGRTDRWLGVESSVILDDSDRVVGFTLLITDLTEIKKLQIELETNRRLAALGEMTGGLAHQLRNSLAAISGFSQLLQKKTGPDSDLGDIAESVRTEAAASETMVSRFLTFARPLFLSEEIFDLRQLAQDCLGKFGAEAESLGARMSLKGASDEINIIGDALLLKEALCNVIDNGLEAAGAKGQVELDIRVYGQDLRLTVTDDGPGIPEKIRDELFTPFVSSKPSGTGLGLALARKIINLHEGTITFENALPRGTTCVISLPRRVAVEAGSPLSV